MTIYLDHNATTPIHPAVVDAMVACHRRGLANPASQHGAGQEARRTIEEARRRIAGLLGAEVDGRQPDRLIFTSGGTEANNLAVFGYCGAAADHEGEASADNEPRRLIVSAVEHQSILEPAERLLEMGWRVDTLGVDAAGVVRVGQLEAMLTPRTRLVSVMLANHETGVLQPVVALAVICRRLGVPLHTDVVQAAGQMPIKFRQLGADALSVSAHKFGGPPGIGALLLRGDAARAPRPILFGGHQQRRLRPGTEPVALAVGMATALRICADEADARRRHVTGLRERFEQRLRAALPRVVVHGDSAERLPRTANIGFSGYDGRQLLLGLDAAGVACSIGSACSSGAAELSPTLRAMGLPGPLVRGSIRFSLGATTTEEEIDEAVRRIVEVCHRMDVSDRTAREARAGDQSASG